MEWLTLARSANPHDDSEYVDDDTEIHKITNLFANRLNIIFPTDGDFSVAQSPTKNVSLPPTFAQPDPISLKQILLMCTSFWVISLSTSPSLPTLTSLLLTQSPPPIAFEILVTMFEHSTRPKLYFATDSIAHGSLALTFSSLAHKFFPKTAEKLQFLGALSPTSLSVIFDKLLVDLLPMASAIRVFTEFIKSGVKVLFRYGLALISMHKKVIKNGMFSDGGMLWGKIAELNSEANFSFDKLQLIAFQKVWGKR